MSNNPRILVRLRNRKMTDFINTVMNMNYSENIKTLKVVSPGLWIAGIKFVVINDGKIIHTFREKTDIDTSVVYEGLKVQLSEKLLEELKTIKKPSKKSKEDMYMFSNAPYPVFSKLSFDREIDSNLMGLIKVIDTSDPATMEDLGFVDDNFWKTCYAHLKNTCMGVCPNGHGISFESLCNFMKDDGWDSTEIGNLIKVKCPCCRKRYLIHDTVPHLCAFFIPVVEALLEKEDNQRSKEDNITTYFSTLDDEDEDIQDLRQMVRDEEQQRENEETTVPESDHSSDPDFEESDDDDDDDEEDEDWLVKENNEE